ncbi:MAG: EamA family transporter [Actinomycetes bacterium]
MAAAVTGEETDNLDGSGLLGRVSPLALVLAATVSVQFGAALAVTLFDKVGAVGSTFLRLALAAGLLLAVRRPRIRGWTAANYRLALAFGLSLGITNMLYYAALSRLPVAVTVTIEFLGPIGVAAAYSRRWIEGLWVLLAAGGILLMTEPWAHAGGLDPVGVALALCAAGGWATYILLVERAGKVFAGRDILTIAMVVATGAALVPGVIDGGAALLDPSVLAVGMVVAILSMVIPFTFELEALRRMPARVFGVLMSLEPAVAVVAGIVVLNQHLALRELIAVALVVIASIGVTQSAPAPPPAAAIEG